MLMRLGNADWWRLPDPAPSTRGRPDRGNNSPPAQTKNTTMKTRMLTSLLCGATLLAVTTSAWALPPRQHSVSGMVEAIDCASRTITLKPKDGAAPLTFVWNESTRFTRKGGCAKCGLASGQSASVSYRREVGQNVLREVSTKGAVTDCSAVCK